MKKSSAITLLILLNIAITTQSTPSTQEANDSIEKKLLALGEKYQYLKEYNSAKKYLNLAAQKGNTQALLNLAAIYYREKQTEKSKELLRKAMKMGNSDAFLILCTLEGKEKEVQQFLKNQTKENRFSLSYNSAMILKEMDDKQSAITLFLQATGNKFPVIWYQIGVLFEKQNNFKQAEYYYKEAIDREEKFLSPRKLANLYRKQKKFDLAEEYYKIAIAALDYSYTWLDLANIYYLQGKYDLVQKCLESNAHLQSEQIQKDMPPYEIKQLLKKRDAIYSKVDALNAVGLAYLEQEEYEKAIIYFSKAIHYKENITSLTNIGDAYCSINKLDLAEEHYNKALSYATSPSQEATILCHLGHLHQIQKNDTLAIENFKRAADKGNAYASYKLGTFYLNNGKYDLAEEHLKFAVDKQIMGAVRALGNTYDLQDKLHLASIFYKYAVDNGDIDALHNLGSVYIFLKKLDLAESYLKKALSHNNKSALFTLGKLYFARQNLDQAEYYYKQALNEGYADAQENLNFMIKLKKNPDQAKALFNTLQKEGTIP